VVATIEALVMEPAQLAAQLQQLEARKAAQQEPSSGAAQAAGPAAAGSGKQPEVPEVAVAALGMAVLTSLARLLEAKARF